MFCCASCGIAKDDDDDVKLKKCNGCYLVRYCGIECQKNHWPKHKQACKKRAAELRDELLFKQPRSSDLGDCPICCLPLPLDLKKSRMYYCCSKRICFGCAHANRVRENKSRLRHTCPFCRNALPKTEEESDKLRIKRIEANDPVAIRVEGTKHYRKGDYRGAVEYWTKAAALGDAWGNFQLSGLYQVGEGVEKDEKKEIHHLEEAAISGNPHARYNLGVHENSYGNIDRAVKHWIIAATQGEDDAIKALMRGFKQGFVEKDVLAAALRAHKVAVDATKSPQRESAEEIYRSEYGRRVL